MSTLKILVFAVVRRDRLEAVHCMAVTGAPDFAHFPAGEDVMSGDGCDFGDYDECAEFSGKFLPSTGLWFVEWDWTLEPDDEADTSAYASYGEDRWSRPTPADLIALGMLDADPASPPSAAGGTR